MLLGQARGSFDDPTWTFGLKYDGYRLMAWTGEGGPPAEDPHRG